MNKFKFQDLRILGMGLVIILALALFVSFFQSDKVIEKVAEQAVAEEIYPLFQCPCCGQPLDKNNICCELARERIDYIDVLVDAEISEDKVILAYVKKYGLESFIDEEEQKEFQEKLAKEAPAERPIISINPDFYDFGDISQKKGIATTFFEIKNEGKTDLVIDKLDSSCGCTSASIVYQGKEGPIFTMAGHGEESPTDWRVVIPSGEKAQLKVYYDPDMHLDFRGAATRTVSVYSDDPIDFQKKVTIELNQVD